MERIFLLEIVKCFDSSICETDAYCNFDNPNQGFCKRCNPERICRNKEQHNDQGMECQKICEGSKNGLKENDGGRCDPLV